MIPFAPILAAALGVLAVILGKALRSAPGGVGRSGPDLYADELLGRHGLHSVTADNLDEFSSLLPRPQAGGEASGGEPGRPYLAPPATHRTEEAR